ncbi:MAG: alkaline phosphatase [Bacteroidota bacterium]
MVQATRIFILALAIAGIPALNMFAQEANSLPRPKNIIIMIAGGAGYNHIKAAEYYQGMKAQVYQQFPVHLAMAHYPAKAGEYEANNPASNNYATGYNTVLAWKDTAYLKKNFTESAAAATAMATGFKTYNNAIGMSVDHDTLVNLVEWAKSMGKSAGVVTTVEFSNATPAAFVAHNVTRTHYSQIAYEMLLDSRCDVIMGCGSPSCDDDGNQLVSPWKDARYVGDSSFWQQLVKGSGKQTRFRVNGITKTVADIDGDGKPDAWTVVRSLGDFRALLTGKPPKRVLGCPEVYSTLQQARTRKAGETGDSQPFFTPLNKTVPGLPEMAGGALNVLGANPNGFFVMIEGGATDWASLANQKGRFVEEMKDFTEAIAAVIEWVEHHSNWNETLMIVTSDHETGLLWGDAPLSPLMDMGKGKLPFMNFYSKEPTNSLVPFYARGAGSELFRNFADERDTIRGPYIQNSEIAQGIHMMWVK